MKKVFKIGTLTAIIILLVVIGLFINYSYSNFKINESFTPIPLSFDPANSTSTYNWNGAFVSIQGGFVKGKITDDNKTENLVLRSISPTPVITVRGNPNGDKEYYIRLENINPVNVALKGAKFESQKILDLHTVLLVFSLRRDEERIVDVAPNVNADYSEFVILGDNRNGYQTFSQIIDQINAINPVFVIDNGDLVFGGEPNRYRLFYETVSKLRVPLYTTIGNHDIRENGRPNYTKLFGPPFYSFNYGNNHFAFLDSSRGWAEKRAIPEEQYTWLENDLKNANGKRIFVISHIPPTDPRNDLEPNKFPEVPGVEETNFFQRLMDNYSLYKSKDHGFPDKAEAERFEALMTKYKVDTVFLSHIHSYFSFVKNGVRYIISGGAGAEILTKDSYYHYLRVKVTNKENFVEMVQLPSPTNTIQDRYIAALGLFASSIYKEYKTVVILISVFASVILLWILYSTYNRWWRFLKFIGGWLVEVVRFAVNRYKERKNR